VHVCRSNTEFKYSLTEYTRLQGYACHSEQFEVNRISDALGMCSSCQDICQVGKLFGSCPSSWESTGSARNNPSCICRIPLPKSRPSVTGSDRLDLLNQMVVVPAYKCFVLSCFTIFSEACSRRGGKDERAGSLCRKVQESGN
jgi:hypothetical protein